MTLASGTRLGPYEIQAPIGAGGMGEVYKARDTRLDRSVAIKILPPALAADADRRARFEREARAVAMLDHPNVCGIYDFGDAGGHHYLVMPFLEGETLASRVQQGPLPLPLALRIGIEIAEALRGAHRVGVVHRDLKPANIFLVRRAGTSAPETKLLDFGLAKLGAGTNASASTIALPATTEGTAQGTILGTFHYMAPEQVEGRDADARTDIWALGVVIYEMVTGARPFTGATTASVIGSILKDAPPPMSSRQPVAPAALERLVNACLMKDPEDRWQSAADIKRELVWIASSGDTHAQSPRTASPRRNRVAYAASIAAATAVGAAAMGVFNPGGAGAPSLDAPIVFTVDAPAGLALAGPLTASTPVPQLAVSPDGRHLVFTVANQAGQPVLWLRSLESTSVRRLPGTDGAVDPFWSPDSQRVAFFAQGHVKVASISDAAPVFTVSRAVIDTRGGAWGPDGTIFFHAAQPGALTQVAHTGGATTEIRVPGAAGMLRWPDVLPNRQILYQMRDANPELRGLYSTSVPSHAATRLIGTDWAAHYGSGHLLFLEGPVLMAQPFDLSTRATTGNAMAVVRGVGGSSAGYPAFSVSSNGVLAYAGTLKTDGELRWIDRTGTLGDVVAPTGDYVDFSFSPDGSRLAYSRTDPDTQAPDVWILDLARGTTTRLTTERLVDSTPAWSPDGERILFRSNRESPIGTVIYEMPARSGGAVRKVQDTMVQGRQTSNLFPRAWLADGSVIFTGATSENGFGISSVNIDGSGVRPIIDTADNELQPEVSPDNRWLAYTSDQSGRYEIYVQEYPDGGQRTLISTAGGWQPRWRADGRELYYLQSDRTLMRVAITPGPRLQAAAPAALFKMETSFSFNPARMDYVPDASGQRFLVKVPVKTTPPAITVVINWPALLKKR